MTITAMYYVKLCSRGWELSKFLGPRGWGSFERDPSKGKEFDSFMIISFMNFRNLRKMFLTETIVQRISAAFCCNCVKNGKYTTEADTIKIKNRPRGISKTSEF